MVINIATAGKIFNKSGYRVAQKITGQVTKNMPEGAVNLKTVVLEHQSGKTRTIYSFLNNEGKAVKTIKFDSDSPIITTTTFDWFKPQERTKMTAMFREKVDPYAFENFGVRKNKKIWDKTNNHIIKNSDTVADINANSQTVTRSYASRVTETDGSFTDEAQLTEIVNGKKTKDLYQRSNCRTGTLSQTLETEGTGLSQEQIETATSNPYFYAMFKNPLDMTYAARTRAFANQGISPATKFRFASRQQLGGAHAQYNSTTDVISATGKRVCKSSLINDLNHEARHKWQKELVDKLEQGLLTDTEEIKLAKAFKENFKTYITSAQNPEAYEKQILEADAFAAGEQASDLYEKFVGYLVSLFPKASNKTLGA